MNRPWGESAIVGRIYEVQACDHKLHRATDQPVGQWCLCYKHSGDHFYTYIPLDRDGKSLRLRLTDQFASYSFGMLVTEIELSDRNFHLLCAGETMKIDDD